jgi:hypothetical protein
MTLYHLQRLLWLSSLWLWMVSWEWQGCYPNSKCSGYHWLNLNAVLMCIDYLTVTLKLSFYNHNSNFKIYLIYLTLTGNIAVPVILYLPCQEFSNCTRLKNCWFCLVYVDSFRFKELPWACEWQWNEMWILTLSAREHFKSWQPK